ncbi:hypothetical protein GQR36_26630 [Enterococcus termitis]
MKEKIINFFKQNGIGYGASFILPVAIILVYARIDIYPGSEIRTVLASDAYSQYVNFLQVSITR